MRIGIAGLIVVAMMLAMVPGVAAWPAFEAVGTIQYENSTTCPYGWDAQMVNLNDSGVGKQPWHDVTHSFIFWDYKITGEATGDDVYVTVNVTSPDGSWFGERVGVRLGDVYDPESTNYIIDLVVHYRPPPTETFTKPLVSGWNLISLPLTPTDNSTGAVLGNDTIAYDAAKSYNTATHQFEDATTMAPGTGYFVHVTTAGDWVYEGTAYDSINVSLSQGLNMVGWVNETGSVLPGALSSIDGSYRYVARWNAGTQSYEVYLPGAPAVFNDFTTMDRGEGYFIAATAGCTLTYPSSP